MVDRCVCCGAIIPEGTQVCVNCLNRYSEAEKRQSGSLSVPILPAHSSPFPAKHNIING